MDKVAAERAWKWVFEFTVQPGQEPTLDKVNSQLFDQKLTWLLDNETDDNILRTWAVLFQNVPKPGMYGEAKIKFEAKFGKQIMDGPRRGPWIEGYERPGWAKKLKTPNEILA